MEDPLRTFVAVPLPSSATEDLLRSQAELRRRCERSQFAIRFTEAEQLHVTLKFLGSVPREQVSELSAELSEVTRVVPPFLSASRSLGAFSSTRRANVIVVRLEDADRQFFALSSALDARLAKLGFAPETRAFVPHVTLARLRRPADVRSLLSGVALAEQKFPITRVVFYQSTLTPTGSVYAPLADFELSGAP